MIKLLLSTQPLCRRNHHVTRRSIDILGFTIELLEHPVQNFRAKSRWNSEIQTLSHPLLPTSQCQCCKENTLPTAMSPDELFEAKPDEVYEAPPDTTSCHTTPLAPPWYNSILQRLPHFHTIGTRVWQPPGQFAWPTSQLAASSAS